MPWKAVRKLAAAAKKADRFWTTAKAVLANGREAVVSVYVENNPSFNAHICWKHVGLRFWVNVSVTRMASGSGEYHTIKTLEEAAAKVQSKWKKAVLRQSGVRFGSKKCPTAAAELRELSVAAWHEIFPTAPSPAQPTEKKALQVPKPRKPSTS